MSLHLTRRRAAALALVACAALGIPAGCTHTVVEPPVVGASLGLGDPCVPPDESDPLFAGFHIEEASLVSGDHAECKTGICVVNHFQGRVSCPLGQAAPRSCMGPADLSCGAGSTCVASGKSFVCSTGGCQEPGAGASANQGKDCCVPGTTTPVDTAVCGQCDAQSRRAAAEAVYCSCRCAVAEGAPPEPDAKLCTCAKGFACTAIQPYLGLGDPTLAGSYCVKEATEYTSSATCGNVSGHFDPTTCVGIGTP